jgi:hypothetical protein
VSQTVIGINWSSANVASIALLALADYTRQYKRTIAQLLPGISRQIFAARSPA